MIHCDFAAHRINCHIPHTRPNNALSLQLIDMNPSKTADASAVSVNYGSEPSGPAMPFPFIGNDDDEDFDFAFALDSSYVDFTRSSYNGVADNNFFQDGTQEQRGKVFHS